MNSINDSAFQTLLAGVKTANPAHVGIIMDGNGRWATARGLTRTDGHRAGLEAFRTILNASATYGVPILTVYAFSSENWKRPSEEVQAIMALFMEYLEVYRHEFLEQDCRFVISGQRDQLSPQILQLVEIAEAETAHCQTRLLNLAVSYGGRQEVTDAVRLIAQKVANGQMDPKDIDAGVIGEHLYLGQLPDPDLIIRTSGEHRLSGFLMWQSAYSELIFHDALWPDFSPEMFRTCLDQYRGRDRRFGLVS